MARFDTTFDASGVDPTTTHEILPAGTYRAQIVESDMRVTRNGMGQYLWLMLDILEGEYQGRKVFDQLNLVNANPTTVEIAQRTLSAICHATGKMQVTDSEELHLIPMTIQVAVKPPKDGYGERNTIRYLVPDGAAPATSPQPSVTSQPSVAPQPSTASTPSMAAPQPNTAPTQPSGTPHASSAPTQPAPTGFAAAPWHRKD